MEVGAAADAEVDVPPCAVDGDRPQPASNKPVALMKMHGPGMEENGIMIRNTRWYRRK